MSAADEPSLAVATIRITRGNPTPEETAALALLLTARLRHLGEDERPVARTKRLRAGPFRPPFQAPGSWA
ncbi:acyl-CoA carboxylase epsilon subunit [Streptomyces yangpuensis]|uniref:acyl-CoA carboxylase epsilon subunit n=1 Tax=Streptomyces yangpuensis TaxID=1648182 RepID=UPI0035DFEB80